MKKTAIIITIIGLLATSLTATRIDRWARLRYLVGTWKMETPEVTNVQTYAFLFNGQFLQSKTRAVFKPTAEKPRGEIHEDINIFSYDGFTDTLTLRSFYSEGYVNTFTLSEVSADGKILTFTTRAVENAPAGTRARLILQKINDREMVEKFYVAWPNKDYSCVSESHMKKVN